MALVNDSIESCRLANMYNYLFEEMLFWRVTICNNV